MAQTKPTEGTLNKRMKQSASQLFIWTSAWVVSLALVAFGPKFIWDYHSTVSIIAILLNFLMGFKMIMANKRHFDDMDELQRKIHFNALAISLGTSMVFGAVYGLTEAVKLFEHTPTPSNILFVMGISYGIAIFFNVRKYA